MRLPLDFIRSAAVCEAISLTICRWFAHMRIITWFCFVKSNVVKQQQATEGVWQGRCFLGRKGSEQACHRCRCHPGGVSECVTPRYL